MGIVSEYWKGIIASVGAILIAIQEVVEDGDITASEWGVIATAVAVALGVIFKRNEPHVEQPIATPLPAVPDDAA